MTRRRLGLLAAAGAVGAVVVVLVFHLYPRSGADRVAHAYDWGEGCGSVNVDSGQRATYARRWRGVESSAVIDSRFLCELLMYARFDSKRSLLAAATTVPWGRPFCVVGDELTAVSGVGRSDSFGDMCSDLGGTLHANAGR